MDDLHRGGHRAPIRTDQDPGVCSGVAQQRRIVEATDLGKFSDAHDVVAPASELFSDDEREVLVKEKLQPAGG